MFLSRVSLNRCKVERFVAFLDVGSASIGNHYCARATNTNLPRVTIRLSHNFKAR
jgi:hypothetical protein